MKLSYRWLRDLVPFDLSARELADALTFRVCPVEGIEELPGGDCRIELEVTYNRPDLLSHLGVAREIGAIVGADVRVPEGHLTPSATPARELATVEVEAADLCPRYTGRVIRGVKVGPSPVWLRDRLEAVGVRPVNNIVDITNLVLYEWGQPLHAFDLATLAGRKIVVRRAAAGEKIRTIDGRERALDPSTLAIADAERPIAVAGVMGGAETEVSERTRDVLLESACFDPIAVRRAVRRLGLASDSSYRFERGVDPAGLDAASRRAAALMAELAGGEVLDGALDADAGTLPGPRHVTLRLARLRRLSGLDIPRRQAAHALKALGFDVVETDETLEVTVPTARAEASREVDLIEEVLRSHGYEKVPLNAAIPIRVAVPNAREVAVSAAKDLLAGAGYREVWSVSFVEDDEAAVDPPLFASAPALRIKNPVRLETPCLRRSLLGGLLRAKRLNQDKGARAVKLFEISTVYLPRPDRQPDERLHLGLLADPSLYASSAERDGGGGGGGGIAGPFFAVKGEAEAVLALFGLGPTRVRFRPAGRSPALDPSEAAEVLQDGERIGYLGKLGRVPAERFDLRERPYVLLLDLEPVLAAGSLVRRHEPLPQFPAVTRDLAAVVDAARPWEEIARAVEAAAVEHLARVDVLSVYEGDPIPKGKKSVAFSMVFRAKDRTLTGEEGDRGRERVKEALHAAFGAAFRE